MIHPFRPTTREQHLAGSSSARAVLVLVLVPHQSFRRSAPTNSPISSLPVLWPSLSPSLPGVRLPSSGLPQPGPRDRPYELDGRADPATWDKGVEGLKRSGHGPTVVERTVFTSPDAPSS